MAPRRAKVSTQAEKRRIAVKAEVEERRLAAQAEERRTAAEKRKTELEVKKLRLELEARRLSQSQNGEQFNQGLVENIVKMPLLLSFVDGKDNLDEYLLRFEQYSDMAKWNRSTWATQFNQLLTVKAAQVHNVARRSSR